MCPMVDATWTRDCACMWRSTQRWWRKHMPRISLRVSQFNYGHGLGPGGRRGQHQPVPIDNRLFLNK
eukprot:jgi/Botrbrau1/5363/Bobra.0346s0033.1